jgi:hypothetical protein
VISRGLFAGSGFRETGAYHLLVSASVLLGVTEGAKRVGCLKETGNVGMANGVGRDRDRDRDRDRERERREGMKTAIAVAADKGASKQFADDSHCMLTDLILDGFGSGMREAESLY